MSSRPMRIVVGPAVCAGCRKFVWYARAWNGMGLCWRDSDGRPHACAALEDPDMPTAFIGQMDWPCTCGHPKGDHYFGDGLGSDGLMHTWCQRHDGCTDFSPAPMPDAPGRAPAEPLSPEEEADLRAYLPSMTLDRMGIEVPRLLATLDAEREQVALLWREIGSLKAERIARDGDVPPYVEFHTLEETERALDAAPAALGKEPNP